MRLIDADALREKIEFHPTSVSVCMTVEQARGETNFKLRCLEDIDAAPTIAAIPVEWLRTFDLYYNGVSGGTPFMNALVEAWKREQEAR